MPHISFYCRTCAVSTARLSIPSCYPLGPRIHQKGQGTMRSKAGTVLVTIVLAIASIYARGAQETQAPSGSTSAPARVEITPAKVDAEVGQTLKFAASAYDSSGARLNQNPSTWITGPFDLATADENGTVTFYYPGDVRVGAIVGGKAGYAVVTVKPQAPARLELTASTLKIPVGGGTALTASAFTRAGDPL